MLKAAEPAELVAAMIEKLLRDLLPFVRPSTGGALTQAEGRPQPPQKEA